MACNTTALDDSIPAERERGILAGFAWGPAADKVVVCTDLGVSGGMRRGIEAALTRGADVEYREIRV